VQTGGKEKFTQLSYAVAAATNRQFARTASGCYVTLSAFALLASGLLFPTPLGYGWLLCAVAAALAAIFGIKGSSLKSILLFHIAVSSTITAFSVYCMFPGHQPASILVALLSGKLLISTLLGFSRNRSAQSAPPDVQARVEATFSKAVRSKPAQTPGLIALQRATGLKLLVSNDNAQYDFRLLFDHDLVFLIGINSFGGIHYSPRINCIVPSRTFHVDVVGESWGGKRSKVNLMLDTEPIHATLEITPEMLQKVREQMAYVPH
jgi:hypothetical protein